MPDEDTAIRPLVESDLPAALAIQSAVYPPFLVEHTEALASRVSIPSHCCFAAILKGELVAYLLAHGWPKQSPPPIGAILSPAASSEVLFIHDLAVGPQARGMGLGRQLVERAFESAVHQKLARAELIAVEAAAAYWRSLGFAETRMSSEIQAKIATYGEDARWMTRKIPTFSSG